MCILVERVEACQILHIFELELSRHVNNSRSKFCCTLRVIITPVTVDAPNTWQLNYLVQERSHRSPDLERKGARNEGFRILVVTSVVL